MAERLRIALLVDRFGRRFGGAEAYGVNLFEVLSQRHDVTVIANDFDHDLPVREIRIRMSRRWPSWLRIWHFARHASALTRSGFDIVHSHMDGPAGDIQVMHVNPYRYRRLFGRDAWHRMLAWMQLRNAVYLLLEGSRLKPRLGRHVVAVSSFLRDRLHAAYGPEVPIVVIPPGADLVVPEPAVRARLRSELGWTPADTGCLLVARNPLRKGLAAVLRALEQLPSHYRLAVVGADSETRVYLGARHPGLAARVTLVAATAQVSPYYQAADVYVHPTMNDTFGMAPLEAMAHGLPVMVSGPKYCGFGQYVTHKHDAWVLNDPQDAAEMTRGLLEIGSAPEVRAHLLRNSRELVATLSWPVVAEKYEALYAASLAARRAAS